MVFAEARHGSPLRKEFAQKEQKIHLSLAMLMIALGRVAKLIAAKMRGGKIFC